MSLQFLDSVYQEIFSASGVSWLVLISKTLGCMILLYTLTESMVKNFTATGQVLSKDKDGFTPFLMLRSVFLILLIAFSTEILSMLDTICTAIEEYALEGIEFEQEVIEMKQKLRDVPNENDNAFTMLIKLFKDLIDMLNPMNLIYGPANAIAISFAWLVDMFIYPIFLAKRYFFMGIIRVFFPLMIALSIYPKTQDYMLNIIKVYARYFLAIIPLAFVTFFVSSLQQGLFEYVSANVDHTVTTAVYTINAGAFKLYGIVFGIILKIILYKESFKIMEKIIP